MLCIGAAAADRTYRLGTALIPGTSNPVTSRRGFGGVARNVAENLVRLGTMASLVTLVGEDDDGRALVEDLAESGVDTGGIVRVPGRDTASYVAVLAPDGELAFGLADMAILDGLTPEVLPTNPRGLATADWVFADCNTTPALLATLANRGRGHRYRLAVDPVSVAKSERLPLDLRGIDLLVLNHDEARAYLGRRGFKARGPQESAAALLQAGAAAVVLTLGADGAFAANREGLVRIPATPAVPVDVTGAGDSLIAAVLHALIHDEPLAAAVKFGCRAAALTVASLQTVVPDLRTALAFSPEAAGSRSEGSTDPDSISAAWP